MDRQKIKNDPEVRDLLKLVVDQFAKDKGFINYSINIRNGSNIGDGFMSIILKINISEYRQSEDVGNEINNNKIQLVAKVPPDNFKNRIFSNEAFKREIFVYKYLFPIFTKFQIDKGISEEQRFSSFPKCYSTDYIPETMDAYIIMEDLIEQGFELQNKFQSVDLSCVEIWAKSLAKFHAVSFAIRDQCLEEFDQIKSLIDPMSIMLNTIFNDAKLQDIAETPLQTLNDTEQDIIRKYNEFKKNLTIKYIDQLCDGSLSEPYSVVNHGDCWINNVLFKFHNGIPKYVRLLDWQICRYGSPVLDITYFIFACTDGNFRRKHYDWVIKLYHKTLCDYLTQLGSDPEKLFPFSALLSQLKEFGKFGLIMCMFVTPMICTDIDELANANSMTEMLGVENEDETKSGEFFKVTDKGKVKYQERMGDVIRDMVKLGYI